MAVFPLRRKWVVLVLLIAVAGIAAKFVALLVSGPPITISKETTFITGPLHPDGFPDYVGALNQRQSEGVTPENNSAVLFWQAVGPGEIDADQRERFFRMLGIPQPPENGDYFVASWDHLETHIASHAAKEPEDESISEELMLPANDGQELPLFEPSPEEKLRMLLDEQLELAMKRPWSKAEFPVWAEWIAANEKPLELLIESSKRPRRYDPLIGEAIIAVPLWGSHCSRDVARAILARAMLRIHENNIDEAWRHLIACHRLARQIAQGPTLVDAIVGITIEEMALTGDQALLLHGKLTQRQIATIRKDLADLPRMLLIADKLDEAERFVFLDCVSMISRHGINHTLSFFLGENENKGVFNSLIQHIGSSAIDWNLILRLGNNWYDRLVAGTRKPTYAERCAALDAIDEGINILSASAKDWKTLPLSLGNLRQAASLRVGYVLVSILLPACHAAIRLEECSNMLLDMTKLAFALEAFRADRGKYPNKLGELAPKYVDELPKDIFTNGADLRYSREESGYLLYSVGPNGKDDGGKGRDDCQENRDCDDIAVRIAAA